MEDFKYIKVESKKKLIFEYENIFDEYTSWFINQSFENCNLKYGHTATGTNFDDKKFFGEVYFFDRFVNGYNIDNVPAAVNYILNYVICNGAKLINKNSKLIKLQRIALNGQTPSNHPKIHIDDSLNDTAWTFIFYVNESDGDTIIFNNFEDSVPFYRCKYKKNKLLIFPSLYAHQALAPIKYFWRLTFAITAHLDTPYNSLILEGKKNFVSYNPH